MVHRITVMPPKRNIEAAAGENLLRLLRSAGFPVNAPCGGNGSCGKCKVMINGREALACQTIIDRDMTVTLPDAASVNILTAGTLLPALSSQESGFLLAFDIGTTTVAAYLLDAGTHKELASKSTLNPQVSFGADVISRIQHTLHGHMEELTVTIRQCVADLAQGLCKDAGIMTEAVTVVSIVENAAMQQLFLGIRPDNLAQIPFAPLLTQMETKSAKAFLPCCDNAALLVVPNISGFVGADTVACILATGMDEKEEITLLVDIGTNGEMVLGNKYHMVACSAAAGPALEGGNIQFGMRGQNGAIAAGIQLMANNMGIALRDIQTVLLAGAFGTYMDPKSACRIGLLPKELETKITAVGNAAGSGARILACSRDAREQAQEIVSRTEALDLAAQPGFSRVFARNMRF